MSGFGLKIGNMSKLIRGLWVLASVGALFGLFILVSHVLHGDSAELQAYCSAVALAVALVPACLAKAVEEATRRA